MIIRQAFIYVEENGKMYVRSYDIEHGFRWMEQSGWDISEELKLKLEAELQKMLPKAPTT